MFRFTIRDVLWLTVVFGLAVGWWVHYRQYEFWDRRGALLDMQLRATGWDVIYRDDGWPDLIPPRNSAGEISN